MESREGKPPSSVPPPLEGLRARAAAYLAALARKDAEGIWPFLSTVRRRGVERTLFLENFRKVLALEGTITFGPPRAWLKAEKEVTVVGMTAAAVRIIQLNGEEENGCHTVVWRWERATAEEPEDWYIVGSVSTPIACAVGPSAKRQGTRYPGFFFCARVPTPQV